MSCAPRQSVLFTLDRLADRLRAEQVVEYHLSRESVYRAQRAGMDAAAIIAFLERVSTVSLPQNVRRSLEEWGALHERLVVHRGVPLLHAVDAATLDALYADAATAAEGSIAALLGRRVAPTAAFVAPDKLVALRDRLLASDRLPALSEGPERQARRALTIDVDGHIVFHHPVPDIAVLRVVEQVADPQAGGSARLTTHSLRQAAAVLGLGADEVLASLQRFQSGPLPAEVVLLVRRWAKRWGRGRLATVTLLQVESAEILADLLADPGLSPHLRRLEEAAAIAVVRADGVKRLRSALQARGMELADQQPHTPKE